MDAGSSRSFIHSKIRRSLGAQPSPTRYAISIYEGKRTSSPSYPMVARRPDRVSGLARHAPPALALLGHSMGMDFRRKAGITWLGDAGSSQVKGGMQEPGTATTLSPGSLEEAKKLPNLEKGLETTSKERGATWARGDPEQIRQRPKA